MQRRLAIVHVAWTILDPQDLTRLRFVGGDRIVARDLPMMGVEATLRPFDRLSGRDHRAIDIDRQASQSRLLQSLAHHLGVQPHQTRDVARRQLRQPPAHGSRRRQTAQPSEPGQDRIGLHVAKLPDPPTADHQKAEQQKQHRDRAEVGSRERVSDPPSNPVAKPPPLKVLPDQLQSGVRSDLLQAASVLDSTVDPTPEICSA